MANFFGEFWREHLKTLPLRIIDSCNITTAVDYHWKIATEKARFYWNHPLPIIECFIEFLAECVPGPGTYETIRESKCIKPRSASFSFAISPRNFDFKTKCSLWSLSSEVQFDYVYISTSDPVRYFYFAPPYFILIHFIIFLFAFKKTIVETVLM